MNAPIVTKEFCDVNKRLLLILIDLIKSEFPNLKTVFKREESVESENDISIMAPCKCYITLKDDGYYSTKIWVIDGEFYIEPIFVNKQITKISTVNLKENFPKIKKLIELYDEDIIKVTIHSLSQGIKDFTFHSNTKLLELRQKITDFVLFKPSEQRIISFSEDKNPTILEQKDNDLSLKQIQIKNSYSLHVLWEAPVRRHGT